MAAEASASAASLHAGGQPAPASASHTSTSHPPPSAGEKPAMDHAPQWLRACNQSLEACSRDIAQYTERMEERNRSTRARRRGDDDASQEAGNIQDPVWKRKGIIPLVFIILSWVYLVYVWRLCAPAIQQRTTTTSPKTQPVRLASRSTGIALSVVLNVLWLMTMWTYVKVISTGPGFVRDHVQREHRPTLTEKRNDADEGQTRQWREAQLGGPYLGPPSTIHDDPPTGHESPVIRVVDLTTPVPAASTASTSPSRPPRSASTEVLRSPPRSPSRSPPRSPTTPRPSQQSPEDQTGRPSRDEVDGQSPDEPPIDPSLAAVVGPLGAGIAAAATVSTSDQSGPASQPGDADQDSPSTMPDSSACETSGKVSHHDGSDIVDPTRTIAPRADAPEYPPWAQAASGHGNAGENGQLPEPSRMPPYPDYTPLSRASRYCSRCQHVKSLRAHHCRRCGTCVLRMDHHCPWVGGCVGARNQKFFFHFVFWVTMLEFFVLVSTAILFSRGLLGRPGHEGWTVDGFLISLFPICAMFILFTFSLLLTHAYLLLTNQTTIEHLAFSRHTRKEEILLSNYFSKLKSEAKAQQDKDASPTDGSGVRRRRRGPGTGMWQLRERKRLKRAWDAEWGQLRWEINHWRLDRPLDGDGSGQDGHAGQGSVGDATAPPRRWQKLSKSQAALANWKQTMGPQWWMWVLPLGRSMSDGLDYPLNPRHGPEGQWRKRSEWPEELR